MAPPPETTAKLFSTILDQLTEGVIVADANGQITFVNEAAERLHGVAALGIDQDEFSQTYHLFTIDGQPYPTADLPLSRAIRGETVLDARWRIHRADGTSILAIGSARPIFDTSGQQVAAVLTLRDDTEREAAERQVSESEARLRALTDNLPGGMVYQISTGPDGSERQFQFVSQSHERLTGVPAEDVLQDSSIPYMLIHPDDREKLVEAERISIETRRPFDVQVRFRRVDGEERWCRILSAPREDSSGAIIWDGIQIDTTEQTNNEVAVRNSERRLRLMADAVPQIVWITDADGNVEFFNKQWFDYTGVSSKPDNAYQVAATFVHPDDQALTVDAFDAARQTGGTYQVEHRIRSATGDYRWFLVRGEPYVDVDSGTVINWFGTSIDIHERKLAEAAVRDLNNNLESEVIAYAAELKRYHDIVDATAAPICAFDTEYRLIAFNRAHNDEFRRVNGFDTKIGDVFPDLFIPEQARVMRELMGRALAGEHFTVVEEFGRPELGVPCWEISYTPLRDESGKVVAAFHHAVDVSERMRAEAELEKAQDALRQSQKMEAMGSLTGGVAHDFNNLLTPIVGSLDLLQRKGLGGERERRSIDGALQAAERAKTLVQRLLAFARRQPLQSAAIDIAELIQGMSDLLVRSLGPQVRVVVDVADHLPPASADRNQLEMAVLNLGVNARDAMAGGGTLRISAVRESIRKSRGELKRGDYIRLSVADTGSGMDERTLARAVEPFFSTKGVGKGTGLGLSMAHGLAAQLGGALAIESHVGVGTRVDIWLPVSKASFAESKVPKESPGAFKQQGLALLVDDEDLVRASTADMLSDIGYSVHEAGSAEEALSYVHNGLNPDVLITDHLMPGMSGAELVKVLKIKRPNLLTLVVSGYAEAEGIAPDLPRLAKPFRRDDLAAMLSQLKQASSKS